MEGGLPQFCACALALVLLTTTVCGHVMLEEQLARAAREEEVVEGGVGGLLGRLFPGLFGTASQGEETSSPSATASNSTNTTVAVADASSSSPSSSPSSSSFFPSSSPISSSSSSPSNLTVTTMDWVKSMNSTEVPMASDSPPSEAPTGASPTGDTIQDFGASSPPTSFDPVVTTSEMPSSSYPQAQSSGMTSCPATVDLASLCYGQITDDLYIYFDWNLTLASVESVVLFSSVLKELLLQCPPGQWCLPSIFLRVFPEVGEEYYESPVCYESLLSCLALAAEARKSCQDYQYVQTLSSALSMLCQLGNVPGLTSSCFSRVLALLHVTVADSTRTIPQEPISAAEICLSRKAQMLQQYECLVQVCPGHREALSGFGPWQWFLTDQEVLDQTCSYSDVCSAFPLEEPPVPQDSSRAPDVPMEPSTTTAALYDFISNVEDKGRQEQLPDDDQVNKAQDGQQADTEGDSTSQNLPPAVAKFDPYSRLLMGISGGVVVGVIGLTCLVCMCWRRGKGNKHTGMKGYTKLPSHVDE